MGVLESITHTTPEHVARIRRLMREHGPALARHIARLGTPSGDVDDVAQQTFLVATAKASQLQEGAERAFLFSVATRLAGNARRSAFRTRRARDRLAEIPETFPDASELEDQRRTRSRIEEALFDMPVELRTMFVAVELEEMSVAEIASELGIAEGTAASRLRRAREKVREHLVTGARAEAPKHLAPEVFSWWVHRGETDALEALLSIYRRSHPRSSVVHAAMRGSSIARRELEMRMARGAPPDTFQANGGVDLFAWLDSSAHLAPLDDVVDTSAWRTIFHPDVLDLVTHKGHVYGVPVDIHRLNTLFYDKAVFAKLNLTPPTSLAELHAVAREIGAAGVTPFAIGALQPWALTLLAFENILVAVAGPDFYRAYFQGRTKADDEAIRETLDHSARIFDHANADASKLGWEEAVRRVGEGSAAMTIMGDWARGYLSHTDNEVGQMASPGTDGVFVFACDTFALPARAAHRKSALDLLSVFASRDGQHVFNGMKGSIPARFDAEHLSGHVIGSASAHDPHDALEDFRSRPHVQSLTSMAPSAFVRALDAAMARFFRDRDTEAVISVLRSHHTLLGRAPKY